MAAHRGGGSGGASGMFTAAAESFLKQARYREGWGTGRGAEVPGKGGRAPSGWSEGLSEVPGLGLAGLGRG